MGVSKTTPISSPIIEYQAGGEDGKANDSHPSHGNREGDEIPILSGTACQRCGGHEASGWTSWEFVGTKVLSSAVAPAMPEAPISQWRLALVPGPIDPDEWCAVADDQFAYDLDEDAASELAKVVAAKLEESAFSSTPKAWRLLGNLQLQFDGVAAISSFRRAAEISQTPSDWLLVGHAAFNRQPEDARSAYLKAIDLDQSSVKSWGAMIDFERSPLGNPDNADEIIADALEAVADGAALWADVAERAEWNHTPEEAKRLFEHFATQGVRDFRPWAAFANTLWHLGSSEAALSALEETIRLAPGAATYKAMLADWLAEDGLLDAATDALVTSLMQHPSDGMLWNTACRLARRQKPNNGDVDQRLVERLQLVPLQALSHSEECSLAWYYLGQLCEGVARYADAERCYRMAVNADPNSVELRRALAILLTKSLSRHDEALEVAESMLAREPTNVWSFHTVGYVLAYGLKRWEEALDAFRTATSLDPSAKAAWTNLAAILAGYKGLPPDEDRANFEEASEAFSKAISLGMTGSWAWTNYGVFLRERVKDANAAEAAFRRALEDDQEEHGAWLGLAKVYHLDYRKYPEAQEYYEKARSTGSKARAVDWGLSRLNGDIRFDSLFDDQLGSQGNRRGSNENS